MTIANQLPENAVQTVTKAFASTAAIQREERADIEQLAWTYILSPKRSIDWTAETIDQQLRSILDQAARQHRKSTAVDNHRIRESMEFDRLTRGTGHRRVDSRDEYHSTGQRFTAGPLSGSPVDSDDESLCDYAERFVRSRAVQRLLQTVDGADHNCEDWNRLVASCGINSAVLANGAHFLTWDQAESKLLALELSDLATITAAEHLAHCDD